MADSPLRYIALGRVPSEAEQTEFSYASTPTGLRALRGTFAQDDVGAARQTLLEAQAAGDANAAKGAAYELQRRQGIAEALATDGATRLSEAQAHGDWGNFIQNTLGQAAGSSLKPGLAALVTGGRGAAGFATAMAGSGVASYDAMQNAALNEIAADPTLSQLSPQDQLAAAQESGLKGAALEAALPAAMAHRSLNPAAYRGMGATASALGGAVEEAATETAQDYAQQKVFQQYDPTRPLDTQSLIDSAAAGALGGGMLGAGSHPGSSLELQDLPVIDARTLGSALPTFTPSALPEQLGTLAGDAKASAEDLFRNVSNRFGEPLAKAVSDQLAQAGDVSAEALARVNEAVKTAADPAEFIELISTQAATTKAGLGDLIDNVNERFGEEVSNKVDELVGKSKDFSAELIDRANTAVLNAKTPTEFLQTVFGNSVDDAGPILLGDNDPGLLNGLGSVEDRLKQFDELKLQRATEFADSLLNDPKTPADVREQLSAMNGDYSNPSNQLFIAQKLISQRGSKAIVQAVDGLMETVKGLGDSMQALNGRIVKHNLQDISLREAKPVIDLLTPILGPNAHEAPTLARQLIAATNRLDNSETRLDDKTFSALLGLDQALSAIDPEGQLIDAIDATTGGRLASKLRAVPSAYFDVKDAGDSSFLSSLLQVKLGPQQKLMLARFVDDNAMSFARRSAPQQAEVMKILAPAFGSPERARAALKYYGDLRTEAVKLDAERNPNSEDDRPGTRRETPLFEQDDLLDDDPLPSSGLAEDIEDDLSVADQDISREDTRELEASYKDRNPNRPFLRGRDDDALNTRLKESGKSARVASMADFYDAQHEGDPEQATIQISSMVKAMRRDLRNRLENHAARDTAHVQQKIALLEAQDGLSVDQAKELKALKARKTEDRSAHINVLKDELRRQNQAAQAAKKGGQDPYRAVLGQYQTVLREEDDLQASDARLTKFREGLDKKLDPIVKPKYHDKMTQEERQAAEGLADMEGQRRRQANADIDKTRVRFRLKDGKTLTLSAESMVFNSRVRGSIAQRFSDAVAEVLARPDVLGMDELAPDAIILRKNKALRGHVTYGSIARKAKLPTTAQKARNKQDAEKLAAWKAKNEAANFTNRLSLNKYLQETFGGNRQLAYEAVLSLAEKLTGNVKALEANWKAAKATYGERTKKPQGLDKMRSKLRVATDYLFEQLERLHPFEGRDDIADRIDRGLEEDLAYAEQGSKLIDVLQAEDRIDTLRLRLAEVKRIPSMVESLERQIDKAQRDLDQTLESVPLSQRGELFQRGGSAYGKRSKGRALSRADQLALLKQNLAALESTIMPESFDDTEIITARQAAIDKIKERIADLDARTTQATKVAPEPAPSPAPARTTQATKVAPEPAPSPAPARPAAGTKTETQGQEAAGTKTEEQQRFTPRIAREVLSPKALGLSGRLDDEMVAEAIEQSARAKHWLEKITAEQINAATARGLWDRAYGGILKRLRDDYGFTADEGYTDLPTPESEGKPSSMDAGTKTKVSQKNQKKILKELARIRGKDVNVLFQSVLEIGASGEFSMNADMTERTIRIAVESLNPLGVAYHEALHDFFATLGTSKEERSLKQDLLQAASAPQVMKRLRELLAGHEQALAQIEKDPEERLAYMYQFWAEDPANFRLGPTGRGLFSKIAQFIRELLGVMTRDQKTVALLSAFHDGAFADPSAVANVIAQLRAETFGTKLRRVTGPIGEGVVKLMQSATDRLRDTDTPALMQLADRFLRETDREKGGLGFLQSRSQQTGKFLNKLSDLLEGSTEAERASAIKNLQLMQKPSNKLERGIRDLLEELHGYMTKSGVQRFNPETKSWEEFRHVKNYFPRVWDKDFILDHEEQFMNLLRPHLQGKQAERTFEALTRGPGSLELVEGEHHLGFTPFAAAVHDRKLTFITEANIGQFAPFMDQDLVGTLSTYIQQAVHRSEYARFFGNNGEYISQQFVKAAQQGASEEELKMAATAVQALEGTLGHDFNPKWKEIFGSLVTYQNIILLPLSLFSSLLDPLGIAVRSSSMEDAGHAFVYGMQGLADQIRGKGPDEAEEMAKLIGIIDNQNMLEAMGQVYNSMHMSKGMRKINSTFFHYNGMETWNRRMRVAAMAAGQRFIVKNLNNKRYMDELGITPEDVIINDDGTLAMTKDAILPRLEGTHKKQRAEQIERRIQEALFRFVDGGVLRPNAGHRPIWASDPRFVLISHLKQFTFSFQNTIMKRVGHEVEHENNDSALLLLSYVPFMLAADILRGSLTGTINTSATMSDMIYHAVTRSGVEGLATFGTDAIDDVTHGHFPGTGFLGPTFDHVMTLLDGIFGNASTEKLVERSIPLGAALRGVI